MGLPSLITNIAAESVNEVIHVYGPSGELTSCLLRIILCMTCHGVTFMLGLYRFLCEVLRATEVMFAVNMFVHELCLRPRDCGILFKGAKRLWPRHTEAYYNPPGMKTNEQGQEVEAYPNERSCFTNLQREEIYSDHNGTWNIIDLPEVTVQARLIVHSVPCFGFSVTESDKSGAVAMHSWPHCGV